MSSNDCADGAGRDDGDAPAGGADLVLDVETPAGLRRALVVALGTALGNGVPVEGGWNVPTSGDRPDLTVEVSRVDRD